MLKRLAPILVLTAACWALFGLDVLFFHGGLGQHGIAPRQISGLPGILWAPFLHGSVQHLAAHSVPLLLLGGILCWRSRSEFALVTLGGIVLSGALTWLIGRNAYHIGASGLIFCFFGYLASRAVFNRKFGTVLLSVAC